MKHQGIIVIGFLGAALCATAVCVGNFSRITHEHAGAAPVPVQRPDARANPAGQSEGEVHPYVESFCAAVSQGAPGRVRDEMRLIAEYSFEQPGNLGEVLQGLMARPDSAAMQTFGEVLMSGRGQPVDELLRRTAALWAKQTADPALQRLGVELLRTLSCSPTNTSANP